jgi:hypothetical protein
LFHAERSERLYVPRGTQGQVWRAKKISTAQKMFHVKQLARPFVLC